jgi:hypothetical protein
MYYVLGIENEMEPLPTSGNYGIVLQIAWKSPNESGAHTQQNKKSSRASSYPGKADRLSLSRNKLLRNDPLHHSHYQSPYTCTKV